MIWILAFSSLFFAADANAYFLLSSSIAPRRWTVGIFFNGKMGRRRRKGKTSRGEQTARGHRMLATVRTEPFFIRMQNKLSLSATADQMWNTEEHFVAED